MSLDEPTRKFTFGARQGSPGRTPRRSVKHPTAADEMHLSAQRAERREWREKRRAQMRSKRDDA